MIAEDFCQNMAGRVTAKGVLAGLLDLIPSNNPGLGLHVHERRMLVFLASALRMKATRREVLDILTDPYRIA